MHHLAFMTAQYLRLVLSGDKTIESRFYLTPRPHPALLTKEGDIIYFKRSGGDVEARTQVNRVSSFTRLTPELMDEIRLAYNIGICGDEAFWQAKREAKRGILIFFEPIELLTIPKAQLPTSREGWITSDVDFLPKGA